MALIQGFFQLRVLLNSKHKILMSAVIYIFLKNPYQLGEMHQRPMCQGFLAVHQFKFNTHSNGLRGDGKYSCIKAGDEVSLSVGHK